MSYLLILYYNFYDKIIQSQVNNSFVFINNIFIILMNTGITQILYYIIEYNISILNKKIVYNTLIIMFL